MGEGATERPCGWVFYQVNCRPFLGAFPLHVIESAWVLAEYVSGPGGAGVVVHVDLELWPGPVWEGAPVWVGSGERDLKVGDGGRGGIIGCDHPDPSIDEVQFRDGIVSSGRGSHGW